MRSLSAATRALQAAWRTDRAIWLMAVAFIVVTGLISIFIPSLRLSARGYLNSLEVTLALPALLLAFVGPPYACWIRLRRFPSLPAREAWKATWTALRSGPLDGGRVVRVFAFVVLFPLFANRFSAWKAAIPELGSYRWDASLVALDRWLHGGHLPHELLTPLLQPWPLAIIDFLYGPVWVALIALVPYVAAAARPSMLRQRFLLSFVALWIVAGVIMAHGMASVGPCYLEWIGSPHAHEYASLFNALTLAEERFSLWALETQALLLEWRDGEQVGRGISAMPSLHVATAVLYARAGWYGGRLLRWTTMAYAVIVQIGSVALGWHYAVDGYVGAIVALLVWQVVAHVLRSEEAIDATGGRPHGPTQHRPALNREPDDVPVGAPSLTERSQLTSVNSLDET